MGVLNTTRRRNTRNKNTSRKLKKNETLEDYTIEFDRWHMDPIPRKLELSELTPEQQLFVEQMAAKDAYERSPEGQAAMRKAYFEKVARKAVKRT
jgi:hypothetical protein